MKASLLFTLIITLNSIILQGQTTGTFVDDRDGHEYKWVKIAGQIWMAENMAYLPQINPPNFNSNSIPYYYVYDYYGNDLNEAQGKYNFKTYGVLYNWPAACNCCPEGWHLPTDVDFFWLRNHLWSKNDYDYLGVDLKEKGTNHWNYPNDKATNLTGFTAIPAGTRNIDGEFIDIGEGTKWWSSLIHDDGAVDFWYLGYGTNYFARTFWDKGNGLSVRCIKDLYYNRTINVKVETLCGEAISNAEVYMLAPIREPCEGFTITTNSYGEVKLPDLLSYGDYTLKVIAEGYEEQTISQINLSSSDQNVTFILQKEGTICNRSIQGTVRDDNGNPIGNATITIIDKQNKTIIDTVESDSQGSFTIEVQATGNPLILSVSKYDPTRNKRYITKNINLTSGEDFDQDIYLTPIQGPIISGWLPKDQNKYNDEGNLIEEGKLDEEREIKSFIGAYKGIFNELSPCLNDLLLKDGEFNIGFEGTTWSDPKKWDNSIVDILHNENIQVIPTLGYMYDQNPSPNLLDNLFQNEDKSLTNKLIETIRDFVVINGLDGFDIDFESFAYTDSLNNKKVIDEAKTLLNKNGYTEFMERLQSELESYNKILYSTIQPPNQQSTDNYQIVTEFNGYCFDYARILNNLHNVRIMCYETMRKYDTYPHSECPILLPDFLIDDKPSNDGGYRWQMTLKNLSETFVKTRNSSDQNNIIYALPTYARNYIRKETYKEDESPYNDRNTPFYSDVYDYFSLIESRRLRLMAFGNDPCVRSQTENTTNNWNIWYQDDKSIAARLGYIDDMNKKPLGICFWALHDLPPFLPDVLNDFKIGNLDYEYPFTADLNIFNVTNDLKSAASAADMIDLVVISPSGREINRKNWDDFQETGDLAASDSAFYEVLSYGDTTDIKVTDYYPEEGDYRFYINSVSDSVKAEYMSLEINNGNDTILIFENENTLASSIDTINVKRTQNSTVTEFTESISICSGATYNGWNQTGTYSRTIQSSRGNDSIIITTNLIVNELPNPVFTTNEDTLISNNNYASYQWYDQNGEIAGATSNKYIIDKSGTYYLEVTDENGCTSISDGMDMVKTGINRINRAVPGISIIPNPNDGLFRVRFKNLKRGKYHVQIINEHGRLVLTKETHVTGNLYEEKFNLSKLGQGTYFIRVFDELNTYKRKFILRK